MAAVMTVEVHVWTAKPMALLPLLILVLLLHSWVPATVAEDIEQQATQQSGAGDQAILSESSSAVNKLQLNEPTPSTPVLLSTKASIPQNATTQAKKRRRGPKPRVRLVKVYRKVWRDRKRPRRPLNTTIPQTESSNNNERSEDVAERTLEEKKAEKTGNSSNSSTKASPHRIKKPNITDEETSPQREILEDKNDELLELGVTSEASNFGSDVLSAKELKKNKAHRHNHSPPSAKDDQDEGNNKNEVVVSRLLQEEDLTAGTDFFKTSDKEKSSSSSDTKVSQTVYYTTEKVLSEKVNNRITDNGVEIARVRSNFDDDETTTDRDSVSDTVSDSVSDAVPTTSIGYEEKLFSSPIENINNNDFTYPPTSNYTSNFDQPSPDMKVEPTTMAENKGQDNNAFLYSTEQSHKFLEQTASNERENRDKIEPSDLVSKSGSTKDGTHIKDTFVNTGLISKTPQSDGESNNLNQVQNSAKFNNQVPDPTQPTTPIIKSTTQGLGEIARSSLSSSPKHISIENMSSDNKENTYQQFTNDNFNTETVKSNSHSWSSDDVKYPSSTSTLPYSEDAQYYNKLNTHNNYTHSSILPKLYPENTSLYDQGLHSNRVTQNIYQENVPTFYSDSQRLDHKANMIPFDICKISIYDYYRYALSSHISMLPLMVKCGLFSNPNYNFLLNSNYINYSPHSLPSLPVIITGFMVPYSKYWNFLHVPHTHTLNDFIQYNDPLELSLLSNLFQSPATPNCDVENSDTGSHNSFVSMHESMPVDFDQYIDKGLNGVVDVPQIPQPLPPNFSAYDYDQKPEADSLTTMLRPAPLVASKPMMPQAEYSYHLPSPLNQNDPSLPSSQLYFQEYQQQGSSNYFPDTQLRYFNEMSQSSQEMALEDSQHPTSLLPATKSYPQEQGNRRPPHDSQIQPHVPHTNNNPLDSPLSVPKENFAELPPAVLSGTFIKNIEASTGTNLGESNVNPEKEEYSELQSTTWPMDDVHRQSDSHRPDKISHGVAENLCNEGLRFLRDKALQRQNLVRGKLFGDSMRNNSYSIGGKTQPMVGQQYPITGYQYPTNSYQHSLLGQQFSMNNPKYQLNDQRYPLNNLQYPINNLQYPINNLQYPTNNLQYPTNNLQYPTNNLKYSMNNWQYPTYNQQYPMNNQQYSMNNQQYPMNNQQLTYNQYPMNNLQYPMNNLQYPMNNPQYPMKNQPYPMNNQQYPTYNQQYSMNNQQFPMNNQQYPINNLPYLKGGQSLHKNDQLQPMDHHQPKPTGNHPHLAGDQPQQKGDQPYLMGGQSFDKNPYQRPSTARGRRNAVPQTNRLLPPSYKRTGRNHKKSNNLRRIHFVPVDT